MWFLRCRWQRPNRSLLFIRLLPKGNPHLETLLCPSLCLLATRETERSGQQGWEEGRLSKPRRQHSPGFRLKPPGPRSLHIAAASQGVRDGRVAEPRWTVNGHCLTSASFQKNWAVCTDMTSDPLVFGVIYSCTSPVRGKRSLNRILSEQQHGCEGLPLLVPLGR